MNIWVLLVYAFVFGVAALVLWVLRYWFVVLPRRDPRVQASLARGAAARSSQPNGFRVSQAAEPPYGLGASPARPARASEREPVAPR